MQILSPVQEEVFDDNIEWGTNLLQIIQDDERRFDKEHRHSLVVEQDIRSEDNCNQLDLSTVSWGHYFSKRSPAVSEIFESEVETFSERDVSLESVPSTRGRDDCEMEQHFKEQEDDSLLSIPSRNSSHSHRHSLNNIHIATLRRTQRFYQFTIRPQHKQRIEDVITRYIHDQNERNHVGEQLLAITVNAETLRCTVLTQIESTGHSNQWIEVFMSHAVISNVLDSSKEPTFTQLSSG